MRTELRPFRAGVESFALAAVEEGSPLARQLSRIARLEHHPGQLGFDEHFQAPLQLDAKGIAWDGLRVFCACLAQLSVNRLLVFIVLVSWEDSSTLLNLTNLTCNIDLSYL